MPPLHSLSVFAVVTLGQFAELLRAEGSGRCLGYPGIGEGAQVGGAMAAFERRPLATTVPGPA